jgi:hypothetical protein
MKLKEVKYHQLSKLKHKILVSEHDPIHIPTYKILKFTGNYREGLKGREDSRYIIASLKAAHHAWESLALILDFSQLDFKWGEDMNDVIDVGFQFIIECEFPIVIVVGDGCKQGMRKLLRQDYDVYCRDNMDDALKLAKRKIREFMECKDERDR